MDINELYNKRAQEANEKALAQALKDQQDAQRKLESQQRAMAARMNAEQAKLQALERHQEIFAKAPHPDQLTAEADQTLWTISYKDYYSDEPPPRGSGGHERASQTYGVTNDNREEVIARLLFLASVKAQQLMMDGKNISRHYVADVEERNGSLFVYIERGYDNIYYQATPIKTLKGLQDAL